VSELGSPFVKKEKGGAGSLDSTNGKTKHHKHHHTQNRLAWIDLIRVASAFMVIFTHVCWRYAEAPPGSIPDSFWLFTKFFDTLFYCAVPMFFMISGYLLLRRQNSIQHGFFKRLLKIGVPLTVWSIIYLIVRGWTIGTDLMGNPINFYNGIRCILTGNVSAHLWFLYAIFSLYLVAPILRSYLKSATRENKIYFLLLWGCACFLCPILFGILKILFDIDKVNLDFYIVGGHVGYFVAGYFLGHRTISSKTCLLCFISLVSLALITTLAGFVLSDLEKNMWSFLVYRLQIPMALLFFVVLKYIGNTEFYRKSASSFVISRFAPLTFGIYIVHILIMHVVGDGILGFSLNICTFDPWFSIPLTVTTVFLLSALVVWSLKKIPHSHWILP